MEQDEQFNERSVVFEPDSFTAQELNSATKPDFLNFEY